MQTERHLEDTLRRIDGRGYKAYGDIRGGYSLSGGLELHIDHVQGDPFAAPSKVRLRIDMQRAGIPAHWFDGPVRAIALRDALARELHRAIRRRQTGRAQSGSGKSGLIVIDAGNQEVLERSAIAVHPNWVEARVEVGLPAAGRRIRARDAETLLLDTLPALAEQALIWDETGTERITAIIESVERQESIRRQLAPRGLIAFVGNGSLLPRESGASDRPMAASGCVPFQSPAGLEVEIDGVRGMGIPAGVTLIVGGGYHGKSTLLRALERSVYPHIPGDGREQVVSSPNLVKVRAEDGRFVGGVDIHAFIRDLPGAAGSTRRFSSLDASGSTSQAASIVEAIEAGASGLLLDEDTSATNFMLRDARMQALVAREVEPITPFVDRVREIWRELGVSTVLVMGGCGDYFEAADTVIRLRDYVPDDATEQAREVARALPSGRERDADTTLERPAPRHPSPSSFDASRGRKAVRIGVRQHDALEYGDLRVDLRGLEQLVEPSQTRALGNAIHWIARRLETERCSLPDAIDTLERELDTNGLDGLDPFHRPEQHPGNLSRPRRHEIAAAVNRMRSLVVDDG
jgi:predicted ABC-class ATPase